MTQALKGLEISGEINADYSKILTDEALGFLTSLENRFRAARENLLNQRVKRQAEFDRGVNPDFLKETQSIRLANWRVCEAPADLQDRRVEITGPVEKKMMINALNSGANVFMADFEDALSPTWDNLLQGQLNLIDAVRRKLSFVNPEGKSYKLNENIATLVVRPRGWHLNENHIKIDGKPLSASLFDFGLYFFHNAQELIARGSGPYFYLPKLESHLEARLWNDVFNFAQDSLKIPRGTVRATVLIETIVAAFEMQEILYELKDHAAGLNAGRWDYIFSIIKKFSSRSDFVLPDRSQITMKVPFMNAYCQLLVQTCHERGAHAMGGMAAFVPSRKDMEINKVAMTKVREDKEREVRLGFDGTWVAHPDLVPIAKEEFDKVLGKHRNQKDKAVSKVDISASDLLNTKIEGGQITEAGFKNNIDVALQYIESWLTGVGAVAIYNLMEDAATAEIARAQLWQWIKNESHLSDGRTITVKLYQDTRDALLAQFSERASGNFNKAKEVLDGLVESKTFVEFLTIQAYRYLQQ